jgi:hypothetical protein
LVHLCSRAAAKHDEIFCHNAGQSVLTSSTQRICDVLVGPTMPTAVDCVSAHTQSGLGN